MPRGFVSSSTGAELPKLRYGSLARAKEKLKEEIQYYRVYYRDNPGATHMNPVFGELDAEQWQKFHLKHCLHHLTQFNLVDSPQGDGE